MLLILIPNCVKHWLFASKCLLSVSRPIFSQFIPRCTKHCVSQVSATFMLPVPFCLFPNSQLILKYAKNCVFTGKCYMSLSSHFFLFPNSQLIPKCAKHCVFTEKMGRETDRRHLLVKRQCFAQSGIRISSMQSDISTTKFGDHKM